MTKPFAIDGKQPRDMSFFIHVDDWDTSNPQDQIFLPGKGTIWLPVTQLFNITDPAKENLNVFVLSTKRCYNGDTMREHLTRYLNYFEKFYDRDHELINAIAKIKCNIDLLPGYTQEQFKFDIDKLILCDGILMKALQMNEDNYTLSLDEKKYKNEKNPSLIYSDRHAKIILWMSLLMNMVIPLTTHFIYINKIPNANEFLLWIFDSILRLTDVDIENKFYETASSNVLRSSKKHERLWNRQDIRGKDPITHSLESVQNIILNIMPKYSYTKNIISFNYTSINKNVYYQVTGNEYEYDYINLSSSIRDSDHNSIMDKYESFTNKTNEGLFLANKVSAEDTLRKIELMFGPFYDDEVNYYIKRLEDENGNIINSFQKMLVFNLFYKYFGDPQSINNINKVGYAKLVIAASRLLKINNLIIMPYIVSSKIVRLQKKRSINKKEQLRLESASYFQQIRDKYRSEKIEQYILEVMATIVASKFQIIDFYDRDLDGQIREFSSDMIYDEIALYVTLI